LVCADILLEMRCYRRPTDNDRRRLFALSRFDETPRELVIELTADGTDYAPRGRFAEEEFAAHWLVLESLFRQADRKLSRGDLLAGWPTEQRPDPSTLYRRMSRQTCRRPPPRMQWPARRAAFKLRASMPSVRGRLSYNGDPLNFFGSCFCDSNSCSDTGSSPPVGNGAMT
jgi:hypothetical protein